MNSRRILHKRCNKFAKSLQISMILQKLCNDFAKVCCGFTRDIAKMCNQFAKTLQNFVKFCTWKKLEQTTILHYFANNSLYPLGNGSKFCKKSAKNRMVNFPGKSWTSVKKTLCKHWTGSKAEVAPSRRLQNRKFIPKFDSFWF